MTRRCCQTRCQRTVKITKNALTCTYVARPEGFEPPTF